MVTAEAGRLSPVKTYFYVDSPESLTLAASELRKYCSDYPDAMLAVDIETYFTHGKTTRLDGGTLKKKGNIIPQCILLPDGTYDGSVRLIQIGMNPRIVDRQLIIDVLKLEEKGVTRAEIGAFIREPLENTMLIGHNFKYDYSFLFIQFGVDFKYIRDTQVIAQVYGAGDYTQEYPSLIDKYRDCLEYGWFKDFTGRTFDEYEEFKKSHQKLNWKGELDDSDLQYGADDVRIIHFVYEKQVEQIDEFREVHERDFPDERGIANIIALECSDIPVFSMMETRGICVDEQHHVEKVLPALKEKIQDTEAELAKYFTQTIKRGEGRGKNRKVWEEQVPIKVRSPKMLDAVRKIIPEITNMKKQTLALYVGEHPSIQVILDCKSANQIDSFFGQGLLDKRYPDGKIHANFSQIGTKTGRSASNDPNMMQMPRDGGIRTSLTAPVGYTFICFDYSQIEPRIAAVLFREMELLEEYISNGHKADIYGITARILLGLAETPKSKEEYDRPSMKTCFLGKIYRMGPKTLADRVRSDSKGKINWYDTEKYGADYPKLINDRFDAGFPNITRAAQEVDRLARMKAEAEGTLAVFKNRKSVYIAQDKLGRIERLMLTKEQEKLPDFMLARNFASKKRKKKEINPDTGEIEIIEYTSNWNDFKERLNQIGRQAFNFRVQGLAASVLKLAARKIYLEFRAAGFCPITEGPVAFVHDEALLQVKDENIEQAVEIVQRCMKAAGEAVLEGAVPILVEGGWAKNWNDAKRAKVVA